LAVSVLANADAGTVTLSELAKAILNDFEAPSPGDLDLDGDIDLNDFVVFAACMAGPEVNAPPPGCDPAHFDAADLEGDDDVDLHDFSVFQQNFTGSPG
jgi:hypothetical protein